MAGFARIVSFVAAGLALLGLVGANQGLLAPMIGFTMCMGSALVGGLASVLVSLTAIVRSRGSSDPAARTPAWIGLAIGLGLILAVLAAGAPSRDLPPINDITTDLADPPAFAAADDVPAYAGRDMRYPAEFVEIVRTSYPDLGPLVLPSDPKTTFDRALAAAESFGWQISARNDAEYRFDAQDATKLFRFVDDVTVRVRAEGSGSRVDVRSKSRDGRGDLGANAKRIERLLAALR